MHDAHREAHVLAVPAAVEACVVQAQVGVLDALHADVRVLGSQGPRAAERGIGELAQRQVGEGRVDVGHWHLLVGGSRS